MKRCPECRRDYYDDTLLYCLDDGNALLEGPASGRSSDDEPATAILSELGAVATGFRGGEDKTRQHINTTDQTEILHTGAEAEPQKSLGELPEKRSFSAHRAAVAVGLAIILLIGGFFGYRYFKPAETGTISSIAVLPFENRSGNADSEYLSDGLSDSLIYRLTQLPNLKVSPTSSVIRYKDKPTDVAEIARELDVDAVMSGKLAQRGDDLIISVELIDARTKKLIWAEQYDRKMSDLLATQREIATAITQKLQLKLAGDETGIAKKYTNINEAYQLYMKARYHYAKRTREDFNKAIEYFQQAVELDPNFALAHAMLSDLYTSMPAYPYMSPSEALPKAMASAKRALEVDPLLPEAHSAMGYVHTFSDRNFAEAERHFRRAIELDPRNSLTHVRYGIYFKVTGQADAAVRETATAVELEPVNLVNSANLTWMYMDAGRVDDALENGKKLQELEPGFVLGSYQLGLAFNASRRYQDAISLAERILAADPQDQKMMQVAGYAYARTGRRGDAHAMIERITQLRRSRYAISYFLATIHAGLGETEAAFAELRQAEQERDWRMTAHIKKDFMLDELRSDARFKELLKRMNLPE